MRFPYRRARLGAAVAVTLALSSTLAQALSVPIAPVVFDNGAAPDGNGNGIDPGTNREGDLLHELRYDFSQATTGAHAALVFNFGTSTHPMPTGVKFIRFLVRAPMDTQFSVQMTDGLGISSAPLPFDRAKGRYDAQGWTSITVTVPAGLDGKIKQLKLIFKPHAQGGKAGLAHVRQIETWTSEPSSALVTDRVLATLPLPDKEQSYGAVASAGRAAGLASSQLGSAAMHTLKYNFDTAPGASFAASRMVLKTATAARFIRFRMRAPADAMVQLEVKEPNVATPLVFPLKLVPATGQDRDGWASYTVKIDGDDKWKPKIRNVAELAFKVLGAGGGRSGALHVRGVELFDVPATPISLLLPDGARPWQARTEVGGPLTMSTNGSDAHGLVYSVPYDLSSDTSPGIEVYTTPFGTDRHNTFRFQVKASAPLRLALRYKDSADRTFDITVIRPFSTLADESWVEQVVRLDHYEGAPRPLTYPIKEMAVRILRSDDDGYTKSAWGRTGNLSLRNARFTQEDDHLDLPAAAPMLSGLGQVNANPADTMGVCMSLDNDAGDLVQARQLGFRLVRTTVSWQRAGQVPSFSQFNTRMDAIANAGLTPIIVLAYNHVAYTNVLDKEGKESDKGGIPSGPTGQTNRAAYLAYVNAAVAHFAKWRPIFEIWNEPNIPPFWLPTPAVAGFAELLKGAVPITQQANATAVSGGLARPDLFPYLQSLVDDISQPLKGLHGVGYHPYHITLPELQTQYSAFATQKLREKGLGDVWITEVGESSALRDTIDDGRTDTNRLRQANNVARQILGSWALGTAMHNVYQWRDLDAVNPTLREHNFGLVTADGQDKPAKRVVKQLFAATNNRVYKGLVSGLPSSVQAMRFASLDEAAPGAEVVYVAWANTPNAKGRITVPLNCSSTLDLAGQSAQSSPCVTDMIGGPLACEKLSEDRQRCPVTESGGPIFIRTKAQ